MSLASKMFFILISSIVLTSCSLGKRLEENKTIFIRDNVEVVNTSIDGNLKYLPLVTFEDCKNRFVQAVKENCQYDNLTLVDSPDSADFVLVLTKLQLSESHKEETVNDENSEYNGVTYELANCEASGYGTLYKGNSNEVLASLSSYGDKEEKIKNNRTLGQLISGANKENDVYRLKMLSDDVFLDVSDKAGKKLEGETSFKISRLIKKGKI